MNCTNQLEKHDYANALRKGRAWYVCPDCGDDISIVLCLLEEAKRSVKGQKKLR